jgi:hypothetical protein
MSIVSTHDGFLYVAEAAQGRILQMSPEGEWRAVLNGATPGIPDAPVRFNGPAGIAMDKRGAVYVADAAAYAIYKLAPRGAATEAPAIVRAAVAMESPAPSTTPRKAARTPWPVKPQDGWHEVVGTMGKSEEIITARTATISTAASMCRRLSGRLYWLSPMKKSAVLFQPGATAN